MIIFLLFISSFCLYLSYISSSYLNFKRQRNQIGLRIHVNGIRGKSTVTRYTAAVLRAAQYHTFGKTTGSAARILLPNGQDFDFGRKGYPNVNEQVRILKNFSRLKAQAIVMECMAVNPIYARWLEDKVMRSHIGIITNVRYDHPDYMGETLEEIAESLSQTIPRNGILITAEQNPQLLEILGNHARRKRSRMIVANRRAVQAEDLAEFSHFAIDDNVAIGYEIAQILNLPLNQALQAMQAAIADPGAFKVQHLQYQQSTIAWANLFAVNDRESFVELCQKLFAQYAHYQKVVILNNRSDRPTRVKLFAQLAQDLAFDRVITFGDYEATVNKAFAADPGRIVNLGNSSKFKQASAAEILTQITAAVDGKEVLLIGTVNIHTVQAEKLLRFITEQLETEQLEQAIAVNRVAQQQPKEEKTTCSKQLTALKFADYPW